MSFTSAVFLILFFPCILANYFFNERYRNFFLCIMSFVFYAWCGIRFLLLIIISATLAYLFGLAIERAREGWSRKCILALGLFLQLSTLFYHKYLYDLISAIAPWITDVFGREVIFAAGSIALPLGISFYTFSILSYLLDIYWGICNAQKRISLVYFYVLFFPKMVQGPIMRYKDFESQLNNRIVNLESLNVGMERFIKGMMKKVLIADQLQGLVTYSFSNIDGVGTIPAWLGIISFMLQLYYDFSGYSDMALGLGSMVGFSLPENFNYPYMSDSVAEFWRRWHTSLGEWFKDYVYTPCMRQLTGTAWVRKLKNPFLISDITALIVTWTLTGIWHGSGLKFFVYGLWYCMFIVLERLNNNRRKRLRKEGKLKKKTMGQKFVSHVVTIAVVIIGQVIFRADSMRTALRYIKKLLIWNTEDGLLFFYQFNNYIVVILVVALIFVFPVYPKLKNRMLRLGSDKWPKNCILIVYRLGLLAAFFITFSYSVSNGYNAFLYEVF